MVPTLKIPKDQLKNNSFINGYIKDDEREVQYPDSIYLLFRPDDLNKFRIFLDDEYERTKSIIDDYNYDNGFVVVVYQLDVKYKSDFSLIRKGHYSKTSKAFQKLFPQIVKITRNGLHHDEISLQYRIFNKTADLVEFWEKEFDMSFDPEYEVWEGFDEEKEVLNYKKIKQYVE